ncbi:MAG: TonB-dependent receptor family protein, partial [Prevotellaceae bacterium]|nr:TonB-dependent receptor family protein [Prevotellaceae bacterium]
MSYYFMNKSLARKLSCAVALSSGLFFATGTQAASLKGTLVDARNGSPLIGTVVQATSAADSTQRFYATTAVDGSFSLKGLTAQRYKLSAKYLGYKDWTTTADLKDEDKDLGKIRMSSGEIDLNEVEVTGKAVRAEQRGDPTSFNVDSYKVTQDATTEDLLKKLPGVTVEDGTVKTQGEDVKRVLVDGKPFFGDDPTIAIRNLPADAISKIEVYDRMSDQAQLTGFDDGNSEKTLNIITKEDRRSGQFGRVYAGGGQDILAGEGAGDFRYSAGGNVSLFNNQRRISLVAMSNNVNQQQFAQEDLVSSSGGGRRGGRGFGGGSAAGIATTHALGLNYSDMWGKKIEVTGSYFVNAMESTSERESHRQYLRGQDSIQLYDSRSNSTITNLNHRFNLRMEYKIDDKKSLLYTPNLSFQTRESESASNSQMVGLSGANASNSAQSHALNFRNELLWRQSFDKKGRSFSVSMRFNIGDGEANSSVLNNTWSLGDTIRRDQKSENPSNDYSLSGGLNYTEPLGTHGIAMLSYDLSYAPGKSNKHTYNLDSLTRTYSNIDSLYSNIYSNDYITHRAGLSYRYRTEALNASVGVDAEYAMLDG